MLIAEVLAHVRQREALAGFTRIALGSTVAGEPLYPPKGCKEVSREVLKGENGSDSLVIIMEKSH